MKISELGEWKLIDQIAKQFGSKNLSPGTIGIGDDTCVIPWTESSSLLVTTDLLLEGTHFLKDHISPDDLGFKSLAVNLSDIASMGGNPTSAFLSLGLPADLEVEWLNSFFKGIESLTDSFHVSLLGGDTTESQQGIVINVMVLGKIENRFLKLRSAAQPGDWICVTGSLGDSAAALRLLLEEKSIDPELKLKWDRPKPYVTEGRWLARQPGVHAMMDVSDGLDRTLQQVLRKSKCGAHVEMTDLPMSESLRKICFQEQWNRYELATAGGEEYCLLVTLSPDQAKSIMPEYERTFSEPLFVIGKTTAEAEGLKYFLEGEPFQGVIRNWNHFEKIDERSSKSMTNPS